MEAKAIIDAVRDVVSTKAMCNSLVPQPLQAEHMPNHILPQPLHHRLDAIVMRSLLPHLYVCAEAGRLFLTGCDIRRGQCGLLRPCAH